MISEKNNSDSKLSEEKITEINENIDNENNTVKMDFFDRNWSWILAFIISCIFMICLMIYMEATPFGWNSFTLVDSIHQYVPFFSDYRDKLLSGESLAYTWDVGLGQNFQSLMLYYMASPLNLIIIFFKREGIVKMMTLLIALKMVLSAASFGYMLSRRHGKIRNNLIITALSFGYAFSTYMCGYFWNLMWLDCIMVFPLIILGFERIVEKKDPRLYILALFYSMYCNYYISFIICIFLVFWFLAEGHKNFKKFIVDGLIFAGSSILAAGMASVSLLTAYLAISKTASAKSIDIPKWEWYQNFFELIKSHIFLTKPITMDVFDGKANLFCGTLTVMTLFIYICSDKVKIIEKIRKLLLLAFLFISMNNKLLNYIWHGFHDQYGIPNRFAFLYIFVLLVIAFDVVSDMDKTNVISVAVGIILTSSLLALTYHNVQFDGNLSDTKMMMISYGIIVVYAAFLMLRSGELLGPKLYATLIGVCFTAEMLTGAWVGMAKNGIADAEYYMEYSEEMEELVAEVEQQAAEDSHSFYRQDLIKPRMLDENTYDNMKSVGTFCSTVRGDMVDAMAHLGFYTGANEYLYDGATLMTNDIFGVRYIYARMGDYFPGREDYKLIKEAENTSVYENVNALPIAYAVDSKIYDWDSDSYDSAEVLNKFAKCSAGVDEIFVREHPHYNVSGTNCMAEYHSNSPETISYAGGSGDSITVVASFVVENPGRYYLNCRANYQDKLELEINDEYRTSGRYQTQMFDLGEVEEGDKVTIKIHFNSNYSPDGTISMYLSRLNRDNLTKLRASLMKNAMNVVQITDDSVKGKIYLEQDQVVFTTIPYDEGWKVYVDGKEDCIDYVGDGFIGLQLDEGEHEIYFKFTPDGMIKGLIITIVSWIIYIFIIILIKKKNGFHEELRTS